MKNKFTKEKMKVDLYEVSFGYVIVYGDCSFVFSTRDLLDKWLTKVHKKIILTVWGMVNSDGKISKKSNASHH